MTRRIKDALTAERALSQAGNALGLHQRHWVSAP
jgi:2-polyprenyl-6-methoxyphenol hydroxylase-like FAD-dependent oxidoreductase